MQGVAILLSQMEGGKRQYHLFVFCCSHYTGVHEDASVQFFLECSGMHVRDCSCE